jgi:two-component system, probable response regulator PhcQ
MENLYDYNRFAVLLVDDEEMTLRYFTRAFNDQFRILTASTARDALKLLDQHKDDIGILITNQRMPGESGVWLLEQTRQLHPGIIRILSTAYACFDTAVAAINTGGIYKYLSKPWDMPLLETTLKRGLEIFIAQRERDQLMTEIMSLLPKPCSAEQLRPTLSDIFRPCDNTLRWKQNGVDV